MCSIIVVSGLIDVNTYGYGNRSSSIGEYAQDAVAHVVGVLFYVHISFYTNCTSGTELWPLRDGER